MKKYYINPKITIIELGDTVHDIITTSGGNEVGFEGGIPADARERRNPIWDDYE